jgi:hypothetical protein
MTAVDRAVIHKAPGVSRVLFLCDGEVVEIWVEGDDAPSLIGGIALATARTAGGAPVADLPAGSGYIRDGRANDGERLLVEVIRDSAGGKRSVLRRRVELAGDGVLLTPFQPELGIASTIRAKGRRMAIRGLFLNVLVSLLRLSEDREGHSPAHRDRDFELLTRYRALLDDHFTDQKTLAFTPRNWAPRPSG